MRGTRSTIWAIVCTFLLFAGEVTASIFAWRTDIFLAATQLAGFVLGCVIAPIVHELGHIVMAKSQDMQIVYAKFSFFKMSERKGKLRFGFASPFAADETQVIPKSGGNMQKRARLYTIGGLLFGGIYFIIVGMAALTLGIMVGGYVFYGVLGLLPFAAYLFLLNVLPMEYNSGKTDALIYKGLKTSAPAEQTMLAAMEIQGELFAGKSYAEIEERLYFDVPQLSEDEPLFAVMLDLRYRYWLDKKEMEKAADCLNRLAQAEVYLTDTETQRIAAEFVYMHALNRDRERAEACAKGCTEYLQQDTLTAKRILAAVAYLGDNMEAVASLKEQANAIMQTEKISGNRKFEKSLLDRLP